MGSPQLRRGDKNVGIHRHKAMALLVYLAVTAQRHSRDALATLFWPNYSQSRARANCSGDGISWFTVGQVELPVQDPFEIGLFAGGRIEREIYPGAFPEGSAIRFESFQMQKP